MHSQETMLIGTKADAARSEFGALLTKRLPHYLICAQLGLLSGLLGVAVTIGLVILVQQAILPASIVSLSAIILAGIAAIVSLGMSWLIYRITPYLLPRLFQTAGERSIQIIVTLAVLSSLIEAILFFGHI